jgi:hypothetical protein
MRNNLPSLMMEMARTKMKGAQAVAGPKGLMLGIDCKMPMMRK